MSEQALVVRLRWRLHGRGCGVMRREDRILLKSFGILALFCQNKFHYK